MDAVQAFLHENYAVDGIEVSSIGSRSLTLQLPEEMHDVGRLCSKLQDTYGATVDLKAATQTGLGARATVWFARGTKEASTDLPDIHENSSEEESEGETECNAREETEKVATDKGKPRHPVLILAVWALTVTVSVGVAYYNRDVLLGYNNEMKAGGEL